MSTSTPRGSGHEISESRVPSQPSNWIRGAGIRGVCQLPTVVTGG